MENTYKNIIQKYIILKIKSSNWPPGKIILSENNLAIKFGCSRLTARSALQSLVGSGILNVKKGLGYMVPHDGENYLLNSFSKEKRSDKTIVELFNVSNVAYKLFDWSNNDRIFCITKSYFRNDREIAFQITFLNKNLIWDINIKKMEESLTKFFALQGSAIKSSDILIKKSSKNLDIINKKGLEMGWETTPIIEIIVTSTADGWIEKTVRVTSPNDINIKLHKTNYL